MSRTKRSVPSFIEVNGVFLKAKDTANHFSNYFADKVDKIEHGLPKLGWYVIANDNQFYFEKQCVFEFQPVEPGEVEKLLTVLG